jgi:hypothetical protein
MSKRVEEFKGLISLLAPVPPMLAKAIGYTGDARYNGGRGGVCGDEAEYFDGRRSATGNWQAFLAYIQHPAVSPLLEKYDLGSSDSEAKHCLILDRKKLELLIAPVKEARAFLTEQWPPAPPLRMSQTEYLAKISEALTLSGAMKAGKLSRRRSAHFIRARRREYAFTTRPDTEYMPASVPIRA